MKHTEGNCGECRFKASQADDTLSDWFWTVVKTKPRFSNVHIAWSWRGETDQNRFFEEGRSFCRWPDSLHNKMDAQRRAWSWALDLFEQIDGKYVLNPETMNDIWEETKRAGWADRIQQGIYVGGKKIDLGHFQLVRNKAGENRG